MNTAELARLVTLGSGITVRREHHASLESAVRRAGSRAVDRVIDEYTVKETWFFRDEAPLHALPWHALLERARARGEHELSVWSAACATGEEAYTLALIACETFGTPRPPVRVYGSDISRSALARAGAARYRSRSTRAVPAELRSAFFAEDGDELVVADAARSLVDFELHNLVTGGPTPFGRERFDVVVCRNVLIYFDGDTAAAVTARLRAAVHEGGSLVLGAADELCVQPQPPIPVDRPPRRRRRRAPVARRPVSRPAEPTPRDLYELALLRLDAGDLEAAADTLRRVLYADPRFALAAFHLACVHERRGDGPAAARLFRQALHTLDPDDTRHADLFGAVDVADVAAVCRSRLAPRRSVHAQ